MPRVFREFFPLAFFIFCYVATTVTGATLYMFGVLGHLAERPGAEAIAARSAVGNLDYVVLLYLPLLVVPTVAWLTIRALRISISNNRLIANPRYEIFRPILWALFVFSVVACAFRLNQLDALNFDLLNNDSYIAKTQRRMLLLSELGYAFFALAYGVNVMLPVMAFIVYAKQGARKLDLILYFLSFGWFVTVVTLTYSKAPVMICALLLVCAAILMRARIVHSLIAAAIAVVAFIFVTAAMNVPTQTQKPVAEQEILKSRSASQKTTDIIYRMAIVHPFVIALFDKPAERCGIQGNTLRALLRLPPPACVLPVKLFRVIYPEVAFVEGQQPAPASLSAYAELGITWSIVVMILTGVILGALGTIAGVADTPLHLAFAVAACSFAYYVTQVPLVAGFLYPHGLIIFMIPVALAFFANVIVRRT